MDCRESLLYLLLASIISCRIAAENFHPDRTRLMDRTASSTGLNNFLFRGNQPINGSEFAYDSLVATMRLLMATINVTLPDNFTLLDISYLNPFEEKDYLVEEKFFNSHPNKGKLYNKIIVGTLLAPPQNDSELIKAVVKDYVESSYDNLPEKMQFFRELLYSKAELPLVIYGHCEAGTDRTGEVSGAYYMKYLNMTFTETLNIDNHIETRDMKTVSRNALQWYCFYLKYVEHYEHLSCTVQ